MTPKYKNFVIQIIVSIFLVVFFLLPLTLFLSDYFTDNVTKYNPFSYYISDYYSQLFKQDAFARRWISIGVLAVVLVFSFKGLWILQLWVRQRIGMKKIVVIVAALFVIGTIDYILESPYLFNLEILFQKSFYTKFRYASANYSSLSQNDISSIYLAILGDEDKTVVCSKLWNYQSGGHSILGERTSLELDSTLQAVIGNHWKACNLDSRFVSEIDSTYSKRILKDKEDLKLVWLSPIKQINGSIYIAYEYYCGWLCAGAIVFKAQRTEDKWSVSRVMRPWVS